MILGVICVIGLALIKIFEPSEETGVYSYVGTCLALAWSWIRLNV